MVWRVACRDLSDRFQVISEKSDGSNACRSTDSKYCFESVVVSSFDQRRKLSFAITQVSADQAHGRSDIFDAVRKLEKVCQKEELASKRCHLTLPIWICFGPSVA